MVLSSRGVLLGLWASLFAEFALLVWLKGRHIPITTDLDILMMPVILLLCGLIVLSTVGLILGFRARAIQDTPVNSDRSTSQIRMVILNGEHSVDVTDLYELCCTFLPDLSLLSQSAWRFTGVCPRPWLTFGRKISVSVRASPAEQRSVLTITVEPVVKELIWDRGSSYWMAENLATVLSQGRGQQRE
jgi:hypothetical protein